MSNSQTSDHAPSWAELNAYVDGELDSEDAARVAAAAAADHRLAREIAQLAELKSSLQVNAEALPPELLQAPLRRHRARRIAQALAACILMAVMAGGLWLTYPRMQPPTGLEATLQTAETLHDTWLQGAGESAEPSAGVLLATLQDFGLPLQIPDLSDTRLSIAHIALTGPQRDVLHVGYLGTRGCQVSLLAFQSQDKAAAGFPQQLTHRTADGEEAYLWKAGSVAYVLLADGMESGRMALIARAVEEATRRLAPMSPKTRSALANNREKSAPCLA